MPADTSKNTRSDCGQTWSRRNLQELACDLVRGELSDDDALKLMEQWNKKCSPPWATADLEKKVSDARNASGKTGYLLVTKIRTDLDERERE